ncbi:MAG: trypsin-like peptidase domain-containing protein [Chitinophagaceae bacterium]
MKWMLCLLFPLAVHCQAVNETSPGKYVYQLAGVVNNYAKKQKFAEGGTCFFIKKDGDLFMVTAKHVLTGCEDASRKKQYYPNKLFLLLKDNDDASTIRVKIDIAAIRDSAQCRSYTDDPDVMVLKMPASLNDKVNTVEDLLNDEPDTNDAAVLVGYNHIAVDKKSIYYSDPVDIVLAPNSYTINEPVYKNGKKDRINYLILTNEAIVTNTPQGMSGAPVFFSNPATGRLGILGVFIRNGTYTEGSNRQNSFTLVKNRFYLNKLRQAEQVAINIK